MELILAQIRKSQQLCLSVISLQTYQENVEAKVNLMRLFFVSAASYIVAEVLIFVDGQHTTVEQRKRFETSF